MNFCRSVYTSQEVVQYMDTLSRRSLVGFVVAIFATACLGFAAGSSHKSQARGTDVNFGEAVKLKNGDTLPAGTYRMEVAENSQTPTVTFSQDGKVKATVEAKAVPQQNKYDETECDIDTQGNAEVLTAIRPQGWDEELLFAPEGQ
jgi:hypothetical protein